MTKMQLGYIVTVGAIFSVVGTFLFGLMCKKINLKLFLYLTVIMSTISTFMYLYIPSLSIVYLYTAIFSFTGGITHIVILTYCGTLIDDNCEAIVFSGLMSILNVGGLLSGIVGAFLFPYVGLSALIIISGLFTFMCIFLIPFLNIRRTHEDH